MNGHAIAMGLFKKDDAKKEAEKMLNITGPVICLPLMCRGTVGHREAAGGVPGNGPTAAGSNGAATPAAEVCVACRFSRAHFHSSANRKLKFGTVTQGEPNFYAS